MRQASRFSAVLPIVAGLVAMLVSGLPAVADTLDEQRAAFREVYPAAERGDWEPVRAKQSLLEAYVLWPDLKAAWLRSNLSGTSAEIERFLDEYGTLKPARELRYRYALHLADAQRLSEYLEIYRRWYQGLDIAKLDCLALHAEILDGGSPGIGGRGRDLWLVGRSQVDECDPVFDYLRGAGMLGAELYRQRYDLAIEEQQFSLARYLARSLDQRYLDEANRWIEARDSAEAFLRSGLQGDDELYRKQLVYALERVAYEDAELAYRYWQDIRSSHAFAAEQVAATSRHIALWLARQHRPSAFEKLAELPPDAVDAEVRRWLVRSALRQRAWADVIGVIANMPALEQQTEEWRYWLAVARAETGDEEFAAETFAQLAGERSYYGFLAADALDREYAWAHAAMPGDDGAMARLAENPALIRARELFLVGLESRGRSEWDAAVSMLSAEEKVQAALLAHRWNWHSRAIATAASVDQYDDLEVRYPLPFLEHFEKHSKSANIPYSWAYGVARSESLFMPDIRSLAGAVGVMQLMPETGRRTAAEISLPYAGIDTLTDPDSNIRLGTFYLGKMLQRFGENRVLATAAYNAGPLRVEKWLPESGPLDARIWIENIPYNETRGYVRRVLVTEAIFHWRLTGQTRRLSAGLGATIDPSGRTRQLADAAGKKARGGS
jgi:soluble lytic murein transglycosylase